MPWFTEEVKLSIAGDVEEQGLSWCYPDRDPFPFWTTPNWYERIRGFGIVLADALSEPLPNRAFADLDGFQLLLLRRDPMVYGWVGVNGYGFVDRFHLERPLPDEPPPDNVKRLVRGCAYALSLDLRLPTLDGRDGMLKRAIATASESFTRLEADDAYREQVALARTAGSRLIAAHWRSTHLRLGPASDDKILTASPRFRPYVGGRLDLGEGTPGPWQCPTDR